MAVLMNEAAIANVSNILTLLFNCVCGAMSGSGAAAQCDA